MLPLKNKNTQPQVNFFDSNEKEYYIEGLVVLYRNEIRIKIWVMTTDTWYTTKMWHTDIKSTLERHPETIFEMGKKTVYSSILDCTIGRLCHICMEISSTFKTLFFEFKD